jgi:hypothetical protein
MNDDDLIEALARRAGLSPTQYRMQQAVPDSLVRDIVADAYRSRPWIPTSIATPPATSPSGGWVAAPLEPPAGVAALDRMAMELDRQEKMERFRRMTTAEQEAEIARLKAEIAEGGGP